MITIGVVIVLSSLMAVLLAWPAAALARMPSQGEDTRLPVFTWASVNANEVVMRYDEYLDHGSVPANGDFTVRITDSETNTTATSAVTNVVIRDNDFVSVSVVVLTLSVPARHDDRVRLDYTQGDNPIQDHAHNPASNLNNTTVANVTAAAEDATLSALTLSGGTLSPDFAPDTTEYTASVENAYAQTTVAAPGNDPRANVYIWPRDADGGTSGHQVALAVNVAKTITINVYAEDQNTRKTYTVTATRVPDTRAPTVSTATVEGITLVLTFDEDLDADSVPAPDDPPDRGDFAVSVTDVMSGYTGQPLVTEVSVSGREVTLALASLPYAPRYNDTVTVSYTKGDSPLRDQAENEVANFTDQPVTNNTPAGSNAGLALLGLRNGVLSPPFSSGRTSYTAWVDNYVAHTTVSRVPFDSRASNDIQPTDADPDTPGHQVALVVGVPKTITITVTAENGVTTRVYRVTATRKPKVTLVLSSATINESGSGNVSTVTATLDEASNVETTVTVSVDPTDTTTLSANTTLTIPAGQTASTGVVTITAVDDDVYTGNKTVAVKGGVNHAGVDTPDDATLTIRDDEVKPVTVSFERAAYTVAEGSTVSVKVALSAAPERQVVVPIDKTDQGGAGAADYSGVPASLTFGASDTEKSFTFSATADDVDDDGESVDLAFGALPDGVSDGTTTTATVSITDDDAAAGTVTLVLTPPTIAESGAGNASRVTASLSMTSSAETTVTVSVDPTGTTTLSSNTTLTIAAGQTASTGLVTITAVDDSTHTGDRTVTVSGSASNTVGVTDPEDVTLTITEDDDKPVTVSFERAAYTVAEGGTVEVKVTLSAAPERSVEIPLTAAGQGGAGAADYSGVPSSLTFGASDTEKSFTFSATADDVDDDGESVDLAFGTLPSGVSAGTTTTATVSITDDDAAAGTVTLVLTPPTIAESGAGNASRVTASLSMTSSAETTVTVSVDPTGTTTLSSNTTLTIAAGQTASTGLVTITAVDDSTHTGDRTVTVSGSASNTVGVTDPEDVTLTITEDDDKPVTVSFERAAYTVAEGGTVEVKVTLSAAPERSVEIPLTAAGQGGAGAADYSGVPSSLTFGASDTEKSFTFSATADDVDDDGESVDLAFGTLPSGVSAGTTTTATVSITDDDAAAGTVTLVLTPPTIAESGAGNASRVTASLSMTSSAETTVTVSVDPTGTTTLSSNTTLTIAAGQTASTGLVTITAVDDSTHTGDRTVTVSGSASNTVGVTDPEDVTLTITEDDDKPVTVSFERAAYTVAEGGTVSVKVTLSAAPERSVEIPLTAAGQGGAGAADYSGVPSSLTFGASDMEKSFTFSATADDVDDDGESVDLAFGTLPSGVSAGTTTTATVSITDDDAAAGTVTLVLTPPTIAESGAGNASRVTASLSMTSSAETTVTVSVDPTGTTTLSSNTTLTIAAGQTASTGLVTITAVDDSTHTGDRTVTVSGSASNTVGVTDPEDVTLTITEDDDKPVTVSFERAAYTVAEGGTVSVKVTLSAAPERSVEIPLTAAGQGGAGAADYSGVPSSLTFGASDMEKSFTFSATADDVDDDGESVDLAFGTLPSGVSAGTTTTATVSITDDDAAAGTVTLVLTPPTIAESGAGNASRVTASLSMTSSAETTVTVSVDPTGTTTLSSNTTLTIAAGQTASTGVVTITAVDDSTHTGDRTVTVSGSASNTVGVTDPEDVTLTITEDDDKPVTVSFERAAYTVAEGGTVEVKVTLSAAPERSVEIPLTAAGQGGAGAADYSGVPSSLTFGASDMEKSFTFSATADDVDDDGESVDLAFGALPDGVSAGTTSQTTVSITDDDAAAGDADPRPVPTPHRPNPPVPAPTPSPTPTPTLAPTPSPTPAPTLVPTPTAVPTPSPMPTPTIISTPTAVPTPSPMPTPTIVSTPTAVPTPWPTLRPRRSGGGWGGGPVLRPGQGVTLILDPGPLPTPTLMPPPTLVPTLTPTPLPTPMLVPMPTFVPTLTPTPLSTPMLVPMPTFVPTLTPTPLSTPMLVLAPTLVPTTTPQDTVTPRGEITPLARMELCWLFLLLVLLLLLIRALWRRLRRTR